jgi:HAD superfamily hydrolase (TIGR01509 family)
MTGKLPHKELAKIFTKKFKYTFTEEMFFIAFAHTSKNEEMISYIKELRKKNIKTALVTNNSLERIQEVNKIFRFDELFDSVISAGKFGSLKTEGKLFDIALETLNVQAQDAVFIDDRIYNIETAKIKGLQTIQFYALENNLKDLKEQIQNIETKRAG